MYLIENNEEGDGKEKHSVRHRILYSSRFVTKLSTRINTNVKEIIVSGLQ